jgi:hypothetical protein
MITNLEHTKEILEIFKGSKKHCVSTSDLHNPSNMNLEEFIFHMNILCDLNLIKNLEGGNDYGFRPLLTGGGQICDYHITNTQLRLTSDGCDFLEAIEQKEIFNKLKASFKEKPLSIMIDAAKLISKKLLKKKVDSLCS